MVSLCNKKKHPVGRKRDLPTEQCFWILTTSASDIQSIADKAEQCLR